MIDEYMKYQNKSLFVIVALHELLGHGTGKLFYEKNGEKNFDPDLLNPINGKPVTYYTNIHLLLANVYNTAYKRFLLTE